MARHVNLIPMAGAGKRFSDAGYAEPKPLIPVAGVPMIIRAAASLPPADHWIFICRRDHVEQSGIDRRLRDHFPGADVVVIDGLTQGQVCTCLTARAHLKADDVLTIGACDNAMVYDADRFERLIGDANVDALIWTFRHNPAVLQNPRMYGWVRVDRDSSALEVSCKIPLSETPLDDHAVIGSFSFRRAADFLDAADELIRQDRRIHHEFYIDVAMQVAIEHGLRIKVFEVDRYIGWGTPQDLAIYHYWRDYFRRSGLD